ncbi:hypothetical protein D9619_011602 [Psilocybe cf. subviscida]|uniref:Wax synthase domain-containing protein n=1 Tax=Psilocybe cf. subviscida TaxID=2480587 RepID=A0A8H5FA36_9AGAR|nr:hypothetical protein D9619_011602 [Psilocybe cf. subviscida]
MSVTEVGWSFRSSTLILFAFCNLLLSNALEDLRLVGQKEAITNKSFLTRLKWAILVWGKRRGIGFTHERGNPPKPMHKTRMLFFLWQFRSILLHALIYDVNGMILRASLYYARVLPEVQGLQRLWRLAGVCHAVSVCGVMNMQVKVLSLVFVGLDISSPADWPDLGGWLLDGWTLRRMWGRVWHQIMRQPCTMHTEFFARKVRLTPKTWSTAIFKLFTNYVSDVYCSGSFTKPIGTVYFFLMQPVGIVIEETVMSPVHDTALAQNISPRLGKIIGGFWVLLWMNATIWPLDRLSQATYPVVGHHAGIQHHFRALEWRMDANEACDLVMTIWEPLKMDRNNGVNRS